MSSKPLSSLGPGQDGALPDSEKDEVEREDDSKLPAHIQSIRDGLLDFNNFIGLRASMLIAEEKDEGVVPLSAYKPDSMGKSEQARDFEFIESAQRLAKNAKSVRKQDQHEWYKLFRAVMTERMNTTYYGSNTHSSIAWRGKKREYASANLEPSKSSTTIPMTGLYFGFPVQELDQRATRGFRHDSSFENYTREQLDKLTTQGLHCVLDVPSSVDEATAQTSINKPHPQMLCFPWAIFEAYEDLKSSESNDVSLANAVSQVSAPVSTALLMFEKLARFADEKYDGQHIPPVIAITSFGELTTVWLAYCDIVDGSIRNHGTITKVWDSIQFCRIADNLFFWAQHCLKPKVTQYLSQWKLRYCPDVPNIYSLLEMDTKTADIVHRIQDHLSVLGLSANEDLSALVRQAVVFQEVMRSSNNRAQEDPTSKEEKKIHGATISLPSRPSCIISEAAISGSTWSQQGTDPHIRPNGKEISHQESNQPDRKSKQCTANFSKLHPEYQKSLIIFPNKEIGSSEEISVILEDIKTAFKELFTNEQNFNFKPSSKEGRSNNVAFLDPFQIKQLSGEDRKDPLSGSLKELEDANLNFVQRAILLMASRVENGHVLSLEKQKLRNLGLSRRRKSQPNNNKFLLNSSPQKKLDKAETDRLLSSPDPLAPCNPFVSKTFEFSFGRWLDLDIAAPSIPIVSRHGPYPTLGVGVIEHVGYPYYPWRTDLDTDIRRMNLAQRPTTVERPAIIEPPSIKKPPAIIKALSPPPEPQSRRVKVPWKGKTITVKLPPASRKVVPIEPKSDSLGTHSGDAFI